VSRKSPILAVVALVALLGVAACSEDEDESPSTGGTSTTAAASSGTSEVAAPLRILVTNDDGVAAPGIDALVEALRELPDVEVTVVAPNENKSGSGSSTTPGELTVNDATTASGFEAKAVVGFPADTVIWALDQGGLSEAPDLVISGINAGQNIGAAVNLSGTVGAARAANDRGIPALAVSQGLADEPDYPAAVALVLEWIDEHRDAVLAGEDLFDNLNVPTCTTGEVRELLDVPPDPTTTSLDASDCTSTVEPPAADVEAFVNGFATISDLNDFTFAT
jgi:5'-nucleotidase